MIIHVFIITTLLILIAWQIRHIYLQKQTIKNIVKKEGIEEMDKKIKTAKKSIDKKMDSLVKEDVKQDKKMEKCEMKMKKKK